jgi:hypothetical protein
MATDVDQAEQLLTELDALLSGPLERAGLGLALEDELRPLLQRAVRRIQADTLDEAAHLVTPRASAERQPREVVVALTEAGNELRNRARALRGNGKKGGR